MTSATCLHGIYLSDPCEACAPYTKRLLGPEDRHCADFAFVKEPLRSRILKDAEEMGRVTEVALAADGIFIGWEGGSGEFYAEGSAA